jgi:hypothetical protein
MFVDLANLSTRKINISQEIDLGLDSIVARKTPLNQVHAGQQAFF